MYAIKEKGRRFTVPIQLNAWQRCQLSYIPFEGKTTDRILSEMDWEYKNDTFYLFGNPLSEMKGKLDHVRPDQIKIRHSILTGGYELVVEQYDEVVDNDIPF
jgi:hypothetical protein